jgi:RimJ/RimL family protein N-acetyltransferase
VPTLDEFSAELDNLLRQSITMLVSHKDTHQPIGFVQAYNLNHADGWCYFLAYLAPGYRHQRLGAEASIAFMDYLFRNFSFRKIYTDLYEFNSDILGIATQLAGFVEEGRFREHIWYGDRYWDVIRLAIHRDGWPELRDLADRVLRVGVEIGDLVAEKQVGGLKQEVSP